MTECPVIALYKLCTQKLCTHQPPEPSEDSRASLSCRRAAFVTIPALFSVWEPSSTQGGSSSGTLLSGADPVWFASQLAICGLVHWFPGGLLAARFVDRGVARVSSEWLHSCPGRALGCRRCWQLRPELHAGARLQLQTDSAQPHFSQGTGILLRAWSLCCDKPRKTLPMLGVPQLSSPCSSSRGTWPCFAMFLLGCKGDFSI